MATVRIETEERDGTVIVRLIGDAGIVSGPILEQEFTRIVAKKPPLVILDLAELAFIASLGMGSLVALHRGIAMRGGKLFMVNVREAVLTALKRSQLDRVFAIRGTMEDVVPFRASPDANSGLAVG